MGGARTARTARSRPGSCQLETAPRPFVRFYARLVVACLVVGAGFLAACGNGFEQAEEGIVPPAAAPTHPTPTARVIELIEVRDGGVVGGVEQIAVENGTAVEITVTSDVRDVVVIAGYEVRVPLGSDGAAALSFRADELGTFDILLEQTGLKIGELTVVRR